MLAVLNKTVAKAPQELTAPDAGSPNCRCKGADILSAYKRANPDSVSMHFDGDSAMAFTHTKQEPLRPREVRYHLNPSAKEVFLKDDVVFRSTGRFVDVKFFNCRNFSAMDDVYCMFVGMLENLPQLRQTYGLSKVVDEVIMITEMYRVLRDRGPYSADQVIQDLTGAFAFVLYDNKLKTILAACDPHGKVPLYWGIAADGALTFSDDAKLLKEGCGKSFAPFPQGCYFSSTGGLNSFEHPSSPVKPVPRIDSQGQMCGSLFKVENQAGFKTPGLGATMNFPVPYRH